MANRLTLLYRFSTDNGSTWVDFTEQVDSLKTSITDNLCTNNFTSAKDEAQFTMPETPLFDGQSNPTPKKLLMDALLGKNDVLIHINATNPATQVPQDDGNVTWTGSHAVWTGTERRFTGYADRSSIDLRSYPLPPSLTIMAQDVSTLHLDDKVGIHICWEDYTIKQIVRGLLALAGYSPTDTSLSDLDTTVMSATDNVSLEAFVVDKDNAKSYREYIDTLLFEAGGYVINFNEYGTPILVHLQWDGSKPAQRIIDNPMNSNGVSMRSSYLKEDGAKLTWSTLVWSNPGQRLWQSGISQSVESGELVGEIVQAGRYWPDGGEITPQFFEYDAKLLDSAYLTRESRRENEDLTIIMAKDVYARADSMRNGNVFTGWDYSIPTSPVDFTDEPYNLTTNPTIWPTKAWWLLHNPTADDINLTFFTIYGTVLYRKTRNTLQTKDSKNPKEYESTYIYNKAQAERFLAFWWHFLQTSRYLFSWTDLNEHDGLNDIVQVGIKGNGSTQKALVVGKTSKWINNDHEVIDFNAVGIETYTPGASIPLTIAPSSSKPVAPNVKSAITATFSTTPSKTLSEWEDLGTSGAYQTWTVTNASAFSTGDVALIEGKISDLDDAPITLYMDVTSVDTDNDTISGNGVRIQYTPLQYQWDFAMSATEAIRQDRNTTNGIYTDITLTSMQLGYGLLPYWMIMNGDPSLVYFASNHSQQDTGDTVTVRIWATNTSEQIQVRMASDNGLNPEHSITKTIAIKNVTEYWYDFGAWQPTGELLLPDHITAGGEDYDLLDGDFFVAKVTFATSGTPVTAIGTENPFEEGWYDRYGSGTSEDPYYYKPTADESCSVGDTYYTVNSDDVYIQGVPYTYENPTWHNEMTATTENSERMLRALATVMNDDTIQPTTSALYAWFLNLTAKTAVIENLFANDIESTNYQEDAITGTPFQGYRLSYNGGDDGAGEIKSAGGVYANMNVRGALRLWTNNDQIAGADIQHPALSTIPASGGDDVGTTPLPTPAKWTSARFYDNSAIPADSILSVSGTYGSTPVSEVVRLTNVNANASNAVNNSYGQGETLLSSIDQTWVVPSSVRGVVSASVNGNRGYYGKTGNVFYRVSSVVVYLNGSVKLNIPSESAASTTAFSTSFNVSAGDSIRVVMSLNNTFRLAVIHWHANACTFYNYGLTQVGMWVRTSTPGWINLGTSSLIFGTSALSFTYGGTTYSSVNEYSLVDNMVNYVTPYAGTGMFYGETNDRSPVTSQTYYTDDEGSNPTLWSAVDPHFPYQDGTLTTLYYEKYFVENGRTYKLDETQIRINGVLKTPTLLSKTSGSVTLTFADGTGYTLNSGSYELITKVDSTYGASIHVARTEAGVQMMGQYPKSDADLDGVGYDTGTPTLKWENGYFKNIICDNPSMNSAKRLKENIRDFDEDALSLINGTRIVTYNFKKDRKKATKIGFIADDTPSELSGDNHDQFKMDHCIAVLIKAVQELNERLEKLEGEKGR